MAPAIFLLVPDRCGNGTGGKKESSEHGLLGVISTWKELFLLFYAFSTSFPFPS